MLNIIAIADDDFLVGRIEPEAEVDILISLGDLYDVTLQKAIDLYAPEHVIAIRGNHCVDQRFSAPTIDLHLQAIEQFGLTFGGFAGSWQYKKAGNHMYTQDEAHQLLQNFPATDVFIAHNSPRGIHERDTGIHQGFDAFLDYIDRAQPAYFLHGHQHCREISYRGNTCIMGIYGEKSLQIPISKNSNVSNSIDNGSRFTETEINRLHLLGRMLASTRNFATSNLNKAGKKHLFLMLDAAHNIPAALLTPSAYEIADDVEHLMELLDEMDNPNFIDS